MVGEHEVSPIFPSYGSSSRCRPLLGWVPRVVVPQRHRSYCGTPTPRSPNTLCFSLRLAVPALPEATRSPRFLSNPCARAPVSDPGRGSCPGPRARRPVLGKLLSPSASFIASASTTCGFRGSMPPPTHSLSTLRSCPRGQTTQDSLPAGGPRPCRLGLAPTGHDERFQSLHGILLSQAFLAQERNRYAVGGLVRPAGGGRQRFP